MTNLIWGGLVGVLDPAQNATDGFDGGAGRTASPERDTAGVELELSGLDDAERSERLRLVAGMDEER